MLRSLTSFFAFLTLTLIPASASDQALTVVNGTDVLSKWSADQHLYVKGDLGVDKQRLNDLETWLDENAKNWTIVLLANARGEVYQDSDGRHYSGMDAVEYTCGKGLLNKSSFGDLKDTRTGQSNGAAFVLFLAERKFSYIGSEAHDTRGLGASDWIGKLDRSAFRAMSNGGRVIDAVKGTVKDIDSRLTRQLALEQQRRQQAVADAQKQAANAGRTLKEANELLLEAGKKSFSLSSNLPSATGDLAKPDIAAMQTELTYADALLTAGKPAEASRTAIDIKNWASSHLQLLAAHEAAPDEIEALHKQVAELNPTGDGWRADQLSGAREELGKAREEHLNADSNFIRHIENAENAIDAARTEIDRARDEAIHRLKEQQKMEREADATTRRYRNGAITGGSGLLACLAGGGVYLSRRRKPLKVEAEELLASWDRGFDKKTESLFQLLDRTAVVIGSEADLPQRGYTGETLSLSQKTIEDVDELFIMSSAVDRILREARELVHPKHSTFQVVNTLSTNRYLRAMKLLRDQPVTFTPEDGIEPILREDRQNEKTDILGRIESYKPFSLSFTQLVDAFNEREQRARTNLDRIENAWATINDSLESTQIKVTGALELTRNLRAVADDDLFTPPAMEDAWIESAQSHLDEAIKISTGDPVNALAMPLPTAQRQLEESTRLANAVIAARRDRFPSMREDARALDAAEHLSLWIDADLKSLSDRMNAICERGVEASVNDEIAQLENDLATLDQRIEDARVLSARLRETAGKQLESVSDAIKTAREEIGSKLHLDPSKILIEEGLNPDARLTEATNQHQSAYAAINRGGVAEAESALDAVHDLTRDALGLIAVTRKSLEDHESASASRRARHESLRTRIPEHGEILTTLRSRFAAIALCLDADEDHEGTAEQTIAEHLDHAEDALTNAARLTDESGNSKKDARLIEAAEQLDLAGKQLDRCDQLFNEIRGQLSRIEETESKNNVRVSQLRRERESLEDIKRDPTVMQSTLDQLEAADRNFDIAVDAISAASTNPFAVARDLIAVDQNYDTIRARADADRKMFQEARRSIEDVDAHLAVAQQLAHRSQTDQIPDSRTIIDLQEVVERLRLKTMEMERTLKVAHGDWLILDTEADLVAGQASRAVAEMRGELKRANDAVAQLSTARGAVREVSSWSGGGYGIRISGSPGADLLEQARQALLRGMYLETQRLAQDSSRSASHAITEARRAVARRREAERRATEERRRAEARRKRARQSSSFGGGSSFGSSSSRSSSSSSMGRSSFSSSSRSSGSGMSRSGW